MSLFDALILAVIQGITEFLPVSSKSHMALYQLWFGGGTPDVAYEFALHIGTIAATLLYFRRDLPAVLRDRKLLGMLFLTTACLGLVYPFRHQAEDLLKSEIAIAIGFVILSGLLLLASRMHGMIEQVGVKQSLAVGIAQCFAVLPGISRSGVTSFGALASGMSSPASFRYIFLCSIPALSGVSAYELWHGLRHRGEAGAAALTVSIPVLLIGIVLSGVIGYFSLILLDRVFLKRKLAWFALYALLLSIVIFARHFFFTR